MSATLDNRVFLCSYPIGTLRLKNEGILPVGEVIHDPVDISKTVKYTTTATQTRDVFGATYAENVTRARTQLGLFFAISTASDLGCGGTRRNIDIAIEISNDKHSWIPVGRVSGSSVGSTTFVTEPMDGAFKWARARYNAHFCPRQTPCRDFHYIFSLYYHSR